VGQGPGFDAVSFRERSRGGTVRGWAAQKIHKLKVESVDGMAALRTAAVNRGSALVASRFRDILRFVLSATGYITYY
jgi:hypothetical protein